MSRLKILALGSLGLLAILALASLQCCGDSGEGAPTIGFKIIAESPHETSSYTQGFFIEDGVLWESAGKPGESKLKKIDLASREVIREVPLDAALFAEGACFLDGKIYQLTWHEGVCLVWDAKTMIRRSKFNYKGEGWGITTDGRELIMSNGSSTLVFRDPKDFKELRSVQVTDGPNTVPALNELEWIDGEVWANVYQRPRIAIINPKTGAVRAWLDCKDLKSKVSNPEADVLNGIALDRATGNIHVTGKYWSKSFQIALEN